MKNKTTMLIGIRKGNGQIGYLSEGLSIPEFIDLIRPAEPGKHYLADFSPVINALHSLHEKNAEQSIRQRYNSIFNYWQESSSYSNPQIKLPKAESLSMLSNELIGDLQFMIEETKKQYTHRRSGDPKTHLKAIRKIEGLLNIYLDILLCFIHSKASLEITSFKKDFVITRYCKYIRETVQELYNRVTEYSTYNDKFELNDYSLVYYIAFNDEDELNLYTDLLPNFDNSSDLRIKLIKESKKSTIYDYNEELTKIEIEYRTPHPHELEMAKILRNLLYKANSISNFLEKLKQGNVQWDESDSSVEKIRDLIVIETKIKSQ